MVDAVLALPDDTRLMVLAPVVRDRKGEFAELFADMQSQGFVRFRIDGQAVEAGELPALKKTEKHDIDVVIDRVKIHRELHDSLRQRLAESFEAALRIADGRAIALEMDAPAQDAATPAQRPAACPRSRDWPGAPLQQQVRLPGVQLFARRDGAAPVLVQLADRRLPRLRRPRPGDGVRRRARRRLPEPEPRERRGEGLGPAQRLHLLDARERRPSLRLRHRRAVRSPARRGARDAAARLGRHRDRVRLRGRRRGRPPAQRQAQPPVRGHPAEPRAPLQGDRFGRRARGPGALHDGAALPRLPRHATSP